MIFDVYAFSNSGGREYNEDSIGFTIDRDSGIFLVADGLGGHSYGNLASECVRDTLIQEWEPDVPDRGEWLQSKISLANSRILELQKEKGPL